MKSWSCCHSNETSFAETWNSATVKALFKDTHLIRTPHYYRQFSLSLGKKPDISSTFNLLQTDTPLIQTFSLVHSVSILKVSNCIYFFWIINFCDFFCIGLLWYLLFRYLPWTQSDWLHQQDHHLVLLAQLEKFFKKKESCKTLCKQPYLL